MSPARPPAICPVCDEPVPPRALACPTCGACHKSGWNNDDDDEKFAYDEFVAGEFGNPSRKPATGWFWWAVSAAVLLAFAYLLARPLL